jgi:hypothetical protein
MVRMRECPSPEAKPSQALEFNFGLQFLGLGRCLAENQWLKMFDRRDTVGDGPKKSVRPGNFIS